MQFQRCDYDLLIYLLMLCMTVLLHRSHCSATPPALPCHSQVGGTLPGGIMLRGLSGGERKRLAIAAGMVAGPRLVFLDEPTSGLDSFAALNVVLFLKSMASERGATLLASLHQPRSAIWGQLDQVRLTLDRSSHLTEGRRCSLVGGFSAGEGSGCWVCSGAVLGRLCCVFFITC